MALEEYVYLSCQVLLNTHPQLGIFVFALAAFIGATSAILLPVETKGREMEVKLLFTEESGHTIFHVPEIM